MREIQATGFAEGNDGVTVMTQVKPIVVAAGGKLDKEAGQTVANKVLLGDKFGQVQLFDASRKLMMDKKVLYEAPR